MNERIKYLVKKKKSIFQNESNTVDHVILINFAVELSNSISFSKAKYHWRFEIKLYDPKTAPKTYWSILKIFVNIRCANKQTINFKNMTTFLKPFIFISF